MKQLGVQIRHLFLLLIQLLLQQRDGKEEIVQISLYEFAYFLEFMGFDKEPGDLITPMCPISFSRTSFSVFYNSKVQ